MWSIYRLRAISRLTLRDSYDLFLASSLLAALKVVIFFAGFRAARKLAARRFLSLSRTMQDELNEATRIARFAAIVARIFGARCLTRSLMLQWLLLLYGIQSSLVIGVERVIAGLDAHAWIEVRGQLLIDDANVRLQFAAFEPFEGPGPDSTIRELL
jgi:hypothetical protein